MNAKVFYEGKEIQKLSELDTTSVNLTSPENSVLDVDLSKPLTISTTVIITTPKRVSYKDIKNLFFLSRSYRQFKTHKKGRINKKWAKRYGYVSKEKRPFICEGCRHYEKSYAYPESDGTDTIIPWCNKHKCEVTDIDHCKDKEENRK